MTLRIRNKLAILLTVSAVMLFAVAAHAAECEDTYYYASFDYEYYFTTQRVIAFDLTVFDAYIYDLPKLPSSWVRVIDSERDITHLTAAAKSDKHAIGFKDLKKFIILKQPNDMSGKKIAIIFSFIYMKKEGGIGTLDAMLDNLNAFDLTVEKINKCLPKKPRRH
ncbi:MAG: hypothetical protein HQK99_15785 [Nitrospirae bacterium]|nr:hypothetical protein [Nitrospirota bacterium]